TIGIGGAASVFYVPSSADELAELIKYVSGAGEKLYILGAGSNVLLPDEGIKGVVLSLGGAFRRWVFDSDMVTAGASVFLQEFIGECSRKGLSGMEGLAGIPGTIGGAVAMNAGYRSVISDHLEEILLIDVSGKLRRVGKEEIEFGYRTSSILGNEIVLEASFCLERKTVREVGELVKKNLAEKAARQPLGSKTLGCVFKNPEGGVSAGKLIEDAGMKGKRSGEAVVSPVHANFIENRGGASSSDFRRLIEAVKRAVRNRFGIDLEEEIEIWE
ncbi:MAG: UDP-N-acetylmuramate dehydrogenase, partial [Candidatus Omnitrophica bacterium]|nr:UDP-N-acetylmuramate dehydrogenase [Candidatus Omnitrophota bacterium]